jgi:Ataxin-3
MNDYCIYHERQRSMLCGQHALNALFQCPLFGPGDLAEIGVELDEAERRHIMARGVDSVEAIKWLAEDSHNVDRAGNFSLDVLRQALLRNGCSLEVFRDLSMCL